MSIEPEDASQDATEQNLLCVAQVIGTFGGGGAQRLAYNLALALARDGRRSLAIAVRSTGPYADVSQPSVTAISLGADRKHPIVMIKAMMRLRAAIRRESIDLIHVHGSSSLPFVVLATRGMKRKPKIVFTWQDSENVLTGSRAQRNVMIRALRCCDSVSGSSRSVAQRLQDGAGLSRVGIFHGGVPVGPASAHETTAFPRIIWVARFVPPKDPQILVRSAARLKAEGHLFTIHLVGKAPSHAVSFWEETRRLVERLQVGDVVQVPGFVPDDQLSQLMRKSHIAVQTSWTEGLSIALMEQMMAGLAIVATDVGDTSVALESGKCGLLVRPHDEVGLTNALRQLLTDPNLRRRMGAAAREQAISGFSLTAMARRALQIYALHAGSSCMSR